MLTDKEKEQFHQACKKEQGCDTETVKEILGNINNKHLTELLLYTDKLGRTALDWCLQKWDKECIFAIVEYVFSISKRLKTRETEINTKEQLTILIVTFPYAAIVSSTDDKDIRHVILDILNAFPNLSEELLHAQTNYTKQTALELLCKVGNTKLVSRILLEYFTSKSNIFSHKCKGRKPFRHHEKNVYKCLLEDVLNEIKEEHNWNRNIELRSMYLIIASEKDFSSQSSFDNENLIELHLTVLDKCMEYLVENYEEKKLSDIFPAFDFLGDNVPCHKATTYHPLIKIGQSNHIVLMRHPYIVTYIDFCWTSFTRYVFYTNVLLYILYLIFFCMFITSHYFETSGTDVTFKIPDTTFTNVCGYLSIVWAGVCLFSEFLQVRAKKKKYWRVAENSSDLLIFIGSVVLIVISMSIEYNSWTHCLGCFLIVISALRGALILTHVPLIGDKFQMLLSVSINVVKFLPVLTFFIVIFAIMFRNLLQNQVSFSHVGFSIVRTIAMAIGELDFGDIFFDDSNNKIHEIFGFIIFVLCLGIMTISMMNLLIGIAVGDIGELRMQSEQEAFRSKVDLILQYNYMFPSLGKKIHEKNLTTFRKFRKPWKEVFEDGLKELSKKFAHTEEDTFGKVCINICYWTCLSTCTFFALILFWWLLGPVVMLMMLAKAEYDKKLFTRYIEDLDREYNKYNTAVSNSLKDLDKLDKLVFEINAMKLQINRLTDAMMKQTQGTFLSQRNHTF